MKISIFSNFFNHHQKQLCDELYKKLGEDFCFVATSRVPEERLSMGYHDMNNMQIPYVLTSYSSEKNRQSAMQLALDSDVMIWGSAPPIYYLERVKRNKLTFVYSERIWKKGIKELCNIRKIISYFYHHTRFFNKKVYLLCNSSFAAEDFAKVGAYQNKAYKWGYFPNAIKYATIENIQKKKIPNTILWVGRFVPWKHPEQAIEAARILDSKGQVFSMKLIGTGELENKLVDKVKEYALDDKVSICKPMSPEKIREEMEASSIFIFTSDYGEGWGAVLNEAMNSACGIVVSNAIGATKFLIKHNFNGIVYDYLNTEQLATSIEELLQDKGKSLEYGKKAYETIINEWNAEVAAERLIQLSSTLLSNPALANSLYCNGPCSPSKMRMK